MTTKTLILLVAICTVTGAPAATPRLNLQMAPLCELQTNTRQGQHRQVRVQGVYTAGLEGQYLVTSGCSGMSTFIEFDLTTRRLWKRLVKLSNPTSNANNSSRDGHGLLVIFEGEFYGPQHPDPKLPEAIRKNYHPGWDPMNASTTKMVVHSILEVKTLPPDHPCAPPKSDPDSWPCWQNFSRAVQNRPSQ